MTTIVKSIYCPQCQQLGSFLIRGGQILDGRNLPEELDAKCVNNHYWKQRLNKSTELIHVDPKLVAEEKVRLALNDRYAAWVNDLGVAAQIAVEVTYEVLRDAAYDNAEHITENIRAKVEEQRKNLYKLNRQAAFLRSANGTLNAKTASQAEKITALEIELDQLRAIVKSTGQVVDAAEKVVNDLAWLPVPTAELRRVLGLHHERTAKMPPKSEN